MAARQVRKRRLTGVQVAIVLPPKEGFVPDAVGAVGLVVRRLAGAGAGGTVLGRPRTGTPFPEAPFVPVHPGWGFTANSRYAAGVVRELRRLRPALIEVWNRPELALRLCGLGVPVTLFLGNDPTAMRRARRPAERAVLLRRMAQVVTASAWLRDRLVDGVDAPARPPVVLLNPIDVPAGTDGPRERLILFAGRMVADKGADIFVDACAAVLPELPGWRAEMIGADRFGPDSPDTPFLAALRPRAAAAGVALRGHLPHDRVLAAMGRAAIVCVPSRWNEPFGLTALEALAYGAALVCSPRGGLPEVAGDAALYADPAEPGALARAIRTLADDAPRRAALGMAGRARAAGFAAPLAAQALLDLRQSIVG